MAERFRFLMNLTSVGIEDESINRAYQRQLNELTRYVQQGKKEGGISKALPTAWIVASYDALLNAAWTLIQYGDLSSEQATQAFIRSFRASLTPNLEGPET